MWGLIVMLLDAIGLNPISFFADIIGTTEPALKLLISILMAYPLAIIYHNYVRKGFPQYKHHYFILTGLDMAIYNFGFSMYYNAIPAIFMYFIMRFFQPSKVTALISFIFNMTYLLVGYAVTESEDYDITWTMPHCVLTLKLIALTFDMWDAEKVKQGQELSANSKLTAIETPPTVLELFGFVYFPSCFLVGPIFSFKRYRDFVSEKYPLEAESQVYQDEALNRLVQGLAYLTAFQVGVSVYSMKYMLSPEFSENSIFYRHYYCGLWGHFALYKYISCWLLTEASAIRFGLSFNGTKQNEVGKQVSQWDACNNIKLMRFEGATRFQHYIDSFNCNTNHFAAEYVYKRLKFLNNRNLSQLFTLLFLALWHGTLSGYYVTFFNEFIIMVMEKELEPILTKTVLYHKIWDNTFGKFFMYALLKTYTIVFMGWSLVPFDLKSYTKWLQVYSSLWFSGFVLFVPWPFVYKPLLKMLIKKLKLEPAKAA